MDFLNILSRQVGFAQKEVLLSPHTTFGIGGRCRLFVQPCSCDEICKTVDFCRDNGVLYTIMGNGSNLLFGDDGFDGVVIKLGKCFADVVVNENKVIAQAGATTKRVYNLAKKHGLGGMEFLATLPASVGGATTLNAGCFGKCTADLVEKVWATDGKSTKVFDKNDCRFGYRDSVFKANGFVVTTVQFCLHRADPCVTEKIYLDTICKKRQSQPLDKKSAGCFFKKHDGISAGYFIDKLGLKGVCVGDAQISQKHAGFVINNGNATCSQVLQLVDLIQTKCKNTFGFVLEPEVVLCGSTHDFRRLSYTYSL